jgi:hypothetical protein
LILRKLRVAVAVVAVVVALAVAAVAVVAAAAAAARFVGDVVDVVVLGRVGAAPVAARGILSLKIRVNVALNFKSEPGILKRKKILNQNRLKMSYWKQNR